ncbi:uncharacterized protein MELLADRAFT_91140 [Melampsora larici-populina 98AG31]|uniref:Uncharacterized protein n=1 Tax=Melampsora larici-populina (strain 98AG31 / pathotype 3-4-7) TaxID=747676 RepID=F4SEG8_MELLP|nr:uncharacterized protein MELLADRAFT_91140 [Melampsora larici-populina 98AG31]EGF96957.1 hypothetical protein MELLADRAFT_91140 [Melampsora larici-populina 98AG31]
MPPKGSRLRPRLSSTKSTPLTEPPSTRCKRKQTVVAEAEDEVNTFKPSKKKKKIAISDRKGRIGNKTPGYHALKADFSLNLALVKYRTTGAIEKVAIAAGPKTSDHTTGTIAEVTIAAGPKTSRNRLLELLENRISKKKGRRSTKAPEITLPEITLPKVTDSNTDVAPVRAKSLTISIPEDAETTDTNEIDFQIYSNKDLEKMLHDVGVNTFKMDKSKMVECCTNYQELIILPTTEPEQPVASSSTAQKEPDATQGSFTFSTTSKEFVEWGSRYGRHDDAPLQNPLPSLQHGTLLYPRPRPTDLSESQSVQSKSRKGKEKESRDSESEYFPEDDEGFDHQDSAFEQTHQSDTSRGLQTGMVLSEDEATGCETSLSNKELTKLWTETRASLVKANKRIEKLECELKSLSDAFMKSLGNRSPGE